MPGEPPSACKCLWLLECRYRTEGATPDSCHRPSRPLRSPSLRRLPLPAGFDPPPPEGGLRRRQELHGAWGMGRGAWGIAARPAGCTGGLGKILFGMAVGCGDFRIAVYAFGMMLI